jgi:hypothetical protein
MGVFKFSKRKNKVAYTPNISRHHVLWERREYAKNPTQNTLREHPGMIIPLPRLDHDQLHMEIGPLPVISQGLARVALAHLNEITDWRDPHHPRLEMFESVMNKFYIESHRMGRIGLEAGMFAEQFEDQRGHMGGAYGL